MTLVVGAGAAGVFAAIQAKQAILLEKTAVPLAKVRVSGGGRCNVTHACFEPRELIKNYPRGSVELLGPFNRFQPRDTVQWFESRGVSLKTEEDGRMFPVTDDSQTIVDCLLYEAKKAGVDLRLRQKILAIAKTDNGFFLEGPNLTCQKLILATGSGAEGLQWAEKLGHQIVPPVPSLFTFNIPSSPLKELSGISLEEVELHLPDTPYKQRGPLLITHFGFSGPAALKLSAWGARVFAERKYFTPLLVNWLPSLSEEQIYAALSGLKAESPKKNLAAENPFHFPKNFWKTLAPAKRLNDMTLRQLRLLAQKLHADIYLIEGKTTHKEEFVTCGGVHLSEVNFKTMESKLCPGLHFAGEILNIDGVTGGFNFQNAWTTGFLSGNCQ